MSTLYQFGVRIVDAGGARCDENVSITVSTSGWNWCNLVWTYTPTGSAPETSGSGSCGFFQGQSAPGAVFTTQGATLEGIGTYALPTHQDANIHVVYNATSSPGFPTYGNMDISVNYGSGYTAIFHGLEPFSVGPLNYPVGTYDLPITIPAASAIVGVKIAFGAKRFTTHPGSVDFTGLITNV